MEIPGMFIVLLTLCFAVQSSALKSYDGFTLLRITPTTKGQLQHLLKLNTNTSSGLDFWLRSTAVNHSADVMVSPVAKEALMQDLESYGIHHQTLIQDLGRLIDEDGATDVEVPHGYEFYDNYKSIDEIHTYMKELASEFPSCATIMQLGTSYQGKPLLLLRVTRSSSDEKPAIWIQGGAHAREQIGPAVVLFIARQLLSACRARDETYQLVDTFDWYIHPVINPDGYEYCQTDDRLWRKTRSINPENPDCVGVDANRNWDFKWSDSAGSSRNPCSHNYAGPRPFSEPEMAAVAEFVLDHLEGHLKLFVDMHSYSQRWLMPWGYTAEPPLNYEEQKRLAEVATSALERVSGTRYRIGSSGKILYTVSGGARDWMYGTVGAPYSYVVEVRDLGQHGFLLPRAQILSTANETWAAVRAMGLELHRILT